MARRSAERATSRRIGLGRIVPPPWHAVGRAPGGDLAPLVFLAAAVAAGCIGTGAPPKDTEGPVATPGAAGRPADPSVADLAGYCRDVAAGDHPVLGPRRLLELRRVLGRLEAEPDALPEALAQARVNLAYESLSRGLFDEALGQLAAARPLVASAQNAERILFFEALAHLQASEVANCLGGGGGDSGPRLATACLLIPGEAAPLQDATHSLEAIAALTELVAHQPGNSTARWLLNIAHITAGTYPSGVPAAALIPPAAFASEGEAPRFANRAFDLGVAAVGLSGAAVTDDFDGDGLIDIFATTYEPCTAVQYYRNDGMGGFTDQTTEAGLAGQLGGFNAEQTDYNNDGYLDIFITRGGVQGEHGHRRNSLLRNNGDGTFTDVTRAAGLDVPALPATAAAWADFDADGDLDVYVGNEADSAGEAPPSNLFRNNGNGTFTDVAAAAGVTNDSMTKGVAWGDYDDDGDPDLYVSNIGPNRLFENLGAGTFTDVASALGVEGPERSFTPWFWDYDNDGGLDIFVAGYGASMEEVVRDYIGSQADGVRSRLYRNDGQGGFQDVTAETRLDRVMLPMGGNYGDIDGDGYLDIYLGTGSPEFLSIVPNMMFRNDAGRRFLDVTVAAGVGHLAKGHGIAFADFDNDGDEDIFLEAGGFHPSSLGANALFENPGRASNWLTVRLVGEESNRAAIGARVALAVSGGRQERTLWRDVTSGGSFGASSLQLEFGLGDATAIDSLEVWWPTTGIRQRFEKVGINQAIAIHEGAADYSVVDRPLLLLGGGR